MKGLSLREAAKGFGISHEGLRKYEQGLIAMDSTKLIAFAKFYGVKVDYLMPRQKPELVFGEIHWHHTKKNI